MHILPYCQRGDHIFLALQNQGFGPHFFQVGAVIGKEGEVGKIPGYFFVALAEAPGQFLAQLRPIGIKLLASSSLSSGLSALPIIRGEMAMDQAR
jgi:hypothetical protein